jgi:hypothetical protein
MVNGQEVKSKRRKDKAKRNRGLLFCKTKASGFFEFCEMQDSLKQDEGNCVGLKTYEC